MEPNLASLSAQIKQLKKQIKEKDEIIALQKQRINDQRQTFKSVYIFANKYVQIVDVMENMPNDCSELIIKRLNDDDNNPFEKDLIRSNQRAMQFYQLLKGYQQLQTFELWVKYSAHGFEQVLGQALNFLPKLRYVTIVNQYDKYSKLHQIKNYFKKPDIVLTIIIKPWKV